MPLNLQEKILQAASELFYNQGIRATGVDAVVKAANTTQMSLYKYFPSKAATPKAKGKLGRYSRHLFINQ